MTKLAEQLTAFFSRVTTPDHKPEPITSSFSMTPANDNQVKAKSEQLTTEKLLKITPSVEQVVREMAGQWVWSEPEVAPAGKQLATTGPLASIGNLKFSDGKKTEKAYMRGPDGDTIQYDRRMPRGAMLGTTESLVEPSGANGSIKIGNSVFSQRFKLDNHQYIPSKTRRRGRSYTSDESRDLLATAIANTSVMPTVTICPTGMAAGTAQYSDQFIGMKIGSTGKGGAPSWVDIFTAGQEHEAERKAHDEMSMKDKTVFAAAMVAQTFEEVGVAAGQSPLYAKYRGGGKRAIIAANDNYAINLQKSGM